MKKGTKKPPQELASPPYIASRVEKMAANYAAGLPFLDGLETIEAANENASGRRKSRSWQSDEEE